MGHMSECSASMLYTQKRSSFSSSSLCFPHPCSWLSHPGSGASRRPHRIPTGEQPLSLLIQPVMSDTLKTLRLTLVFGACLLTEMTVCHTLCWLWYYMRPDLKKHHLFFLKVVANPGHGAQTPTSFTGKGWGVLVDNLLLQVFPLQLKRHYFSSDELNNN